MLAHHKYWLFSAPGIRWLWMAFALFFVEVALANSNAHTAEEIDLKLRSSATLFAGNLSRFKVDDPGIANAERLGRLNLRIRALSPGSTDLRLWNEDGKAYRYRIVVRPESTELKTDKSTRKVPDSPAPSSAKSDQKSAPRISVGTPHVRKPTPDQLSRRPTKIVDDPVPHKPVPTPQSVRIPTDASVEARANADAASNSILFKPGHRPMDLFVGAVSTTNLGDIQRIVMANDQVAEASILDDGDLLVLGKAVGVTELQVLTAYSGVREFVVRVYAAPPVDSLSLLRLALKPFPDVAIEPKLGRLIVTGTVDASDFERYTGVVKGFNNVLSTVTPQLNVKIEHSVVLDVAVLEVNRSYQKTIGIRWQDTAPGPATGIVGNLHANNNIGVVSDVGGVSGELQELLGAVGSGRQTLSGYLGVTSIFGSEIQLLNEEGLARVLAAPSLSTVSGEEATFLAGGDFPVAILNQFGQPVIEFREFGVQLEIQPVVDRNLNVRSRIRAEVSSVDFTTQVNGVPGLLRRETTSTITARPGETIILSGLLDARDSKNVDKLPGLGDIPVLGALFRSEDFIKQRSELIITVTPRIQKPNEALSPSMRFAENHLRHRVLTGSKGIDKSLILIEPDDAPIDQVAEQ